MASTENRKRAKPSEAARVRDNAGNAIRSARRIQLAQDYKRARGCIACGWGVGADEHEVCALQFDHLEGHHKHADVSNMYTCSDERFWAEIRKCQVICARCHAIRESRRRAHYPGMAWQEAKANKAKQLSLDDE